MDQLFFHPKVVHLPMALAVLMPLVTGGVAFASWRGWLQPRVWVIVFALQAVLVSSGIVAMNTGESEEERVEEIMAEDPIEEHEEAAEVFVWGSGVVLLLMALSLVLREGSTRTAMTIAACLGTLVVLGLGLKTGESGGRLVYEYGAAQAYVGASEAAAPERARHRDSHEDTDDDDE